VWVGNRNGRFLDLTGIQGKEQHAWFMLCKLQQYGSFFGLVGLSLVFLAYCLQVNHFGYILTKD
jgi:hypothetical protein